MTILVSILREIRIPILILVFALIFGSIGYKLIYPDISWIKIIFMVAITLTTVGYSDVLDVEDNPLASAYTILLMGLGMGSVLYSVSKLTAFIIEGKLKEIFITEKIRKRIKNMKDHFIICGVGQTGIHVVREMRENQKNFIIIDQDPKTIEKVNSEFGSCMSIQGDATSDTILHEANIEHAKGLIATLSSDKDNLFLTISAHLMNLELTIIAKAIETTHMYEKLQKAGAAYVVSPNLIGGLRIASEILRPQVVSFLDQILRGKDQSMRMEEATVCSGNPMIGETLRSAQIYEKTGLITVAIGFEGSFVYNPSLDIEIRENMVIIVICNPEQHKKLLDLTSLKN